MSCCQAIGSAPSGDAVQSADLAKCGRRAGTSVDRLLVHVGHATADGFQTLEVWESEEHYDRANSDIVLPVLRELAGDESLPSIEETAEQTAEAFEVHGLVIPRGNILI